MKKQKLLQLIRATATLMCCSFFIVGNHSPLPNHDNEDNSPIIEIEKPIPGGDYNYHCTPQSDNYPFDVIDD